MDSVPFTAESVSHVAKALAIRLFLNQCFSVVCFVSESMRPRRVAGGTC